MAELSEDEQIQCDVLTLVTTTSERDELEQAATDANLPFQRKQHSRHGRYYSLGVLGHNRVHAVRTQGMGPLGHGGSAAKAVLFKAATGATGLIQLGMAFGVDPSKQHKGDVLVSTSLIPYDNRDVVPAALPQEVFPFTVDPGSGDKPPSAAMTRAAAPTALPNPAADPSAYRVDYQSRVRRCPASPSLLSALRGGFAQGGYDHGVFFGGMLSGGARIFSSIYLRELIEGVPAGEDGIIGGDMEGVGLLASSPFDDPVWVVVKGISDFADEARHRQVDSAARAAACRNSARFVLDALHNFNIE
jgi:nucleoside phosphorylase